MLRGSSFRGRETITISKIMVHPFNKFVKKEKIKLYYKYLSGPWSSLCHGENINSILIT
jgi:hypothetical protein